VPQVDVSVVIPTFNRPDLLRQTVDSVLAQTRSAREIIVVDNGTDDMTEQVVRGYGSRVSYLKVAPGGVQEARNRGVEAASSTWVSFLDDDDLLHPTYLAHVEPVIVDGRAQMLVTDHRKFVHPVEDGRFNEKTNIELAPDGYWDGIPRPEGGSAWSYVGSFPPERLLRFNVFYPSTMTLRRDFIQAIGGFDPAVRGIPSEDIEFTTRALSAGRLAIVWQDLVSYRMHGSNTSGNPVKQRVGKWRILEKVHAKDAHGSATLAAALAENLPIRRRVVFDLAFRHGLQDLMQEVAPMLRPEDLTPKRRAKLRFATLPAPLRRALLGTAGLFSSALRRDKRVLQDWSPGGRP